MITSAPVDDRLEHVLPFVLDRLKSRDPYKASSPFILGVNGVQGAGKTTLVNHLKDTLSSPPHSLNIIVFSMDDLYLPHDQQKALALDHADNPLVQHRGQPSTHDLQLGRDIFAELKANKSFALPVYDKSAFNGEGDRSSRAIHVDASARKVDLAIFEGWCNGFRALKVDELGKKWKRARSEAEYDVHYKGQLGHVKIEHILFVNKRLWEYDVLTDNFDSLIHIDAEDLHWVYDWRLEAETKMRAANGSGMTDEQVKTFVNGYYSSYELYTDKLRQGIFFQPGKQLRLVVGRDRKVKQVIKI